MPSTTFTRLTALAAVLTLAACETGPGPEPIELPATPTPPAAQAGSDVVELAAAGIEDTEDGEPAELGPVLTPARQAALRVADDLRGSIGGADSAGLSEVTLDGETVVARLDVPTPGADLSERQREAVTEAIRGAFVASVCQRSGFDDLFATGGALRVLAVGNDSVALAQTTVRSCG